MKQNIKYILLFLIIIILSGCNRTLYVPTDTDLIYAEMQGQDLGILNLPLASTYYNVTGLSLGHINDITYLDSTLTIEKNGTYSINGGFSFTGSSNTEYHIALGVNGIRLNHCHAERKIGTGSDVGNAGFTCIDYFNVNDVLTVMVENSDSAKSVTIHDINLNVVRVGA